MTKKEDIITENPVPFGPTGQVVYDRTYSRPLPDGSKEQWVAPGGRGSTVHRVAMGNLALVYGAPETWAVEVWHEMDRLVKFMSNFSIIPGGRHLWATGVKGRQFLFNCHVAPWGDKLSDHFEFVFMRLMEGGGVGANYSTSFLRKYGAPRRELKVHIVCDEDHADYADMKAQGVLSEDYDSEWAGAFPVEDSREGWAAALVDLIDTFMTDDEVKHENRVYDVSRVRKKGSKLKQFGGTASGPAPFAVMLHEIAKVLNPVARGYRVFGESKQLAEFQSSLHVSPTEAMDMDHAVASCVVAGGVRRSARMAGVHWKDPYIFDFINCKKDPSKNWTTNISVIIDDEFLDLLALDKPATVTNDQGYEVYATNEDGEIALDIEHAQSIHRAVVTGMLENGEPGYWNYDLSNEGEVNEVVITNPCGEIALPERGACVLGHVNLDAFAPKHKGGKVDWLGLDEAHRLMTRFLIRATFGDMTDAGQKAVMDSERRIGVGHLGVQGFWAKRGIAYSKVPSRPSAGSEMRGLYNVVRKEARDYAFELRIPEPVKVTTVAPTGSVAKLPGVTEGNQAIYARYFERRVRFSLSDPAQADTVLQAAEDGFKVEIDGYDQTGNTAIIVYPTKDLLVAQVEAMGLDASEVVESQDQLTVDQMLAFQAFYQKNYADNAVSYTVNVPEGQYAVEELAEIIRGYLHVLKGTTVMVDGTRPQAPYTRITKAEYEAAVAKRVEDSTDEDCATGACPVR